MPTNPRVTRVQNLRRSNAAGRHGLGGRRPEPTAAEIIAEHAEEIQEHLKGLAAEDAWAEHVNPGSVSPGTTVEA